MKYSVRRWTVTVLTTVAMIGGGMLGSPAPAATEPDPPDATLAHEAPSATEAGRAETSSIPWPCTFLVLCLTYDSSTDRLTASLNLLNRPSDYVSIVNISTNERVALCGYLSGMICERVGVRPRQFACHHFVAYRGNVAPYYPPAPVVNTSNTVSVCGP